MLGAVQGGVCRRIAVASVLAALGVAVCAVPATAKPPAPGAPGAIHTWAPADKHGFGTSHQLAGKSYFTLRQASLTEVYFPNLSTPSFRGLQFAVTDGRTFVDRETVDDDPRHIEPVAPGVTARVEPVAGSLAYRQVTQTARWRLTKTWITDPRRPTVLGKIRFQSRTGKPLRLYVLADPAPGDGGNDDRGTSGGNKLVASDDAGPTVVATNSGLDETTSGYRGTASDPWEDLQADKRLSEYDARQPGNVVQGARIDVNGRPGQPDRDAGDRVRGGPLGRRRCREEFARRLPRTRPTAAHPSPRRTWPGSGERSSSTRTTASPAPTTWCAARPLPRRHRAKGRGDDAASRRLLDYVWSVQKADGSYWQNTRVDGTPKWMTEQLDQTSLPVVLAWWLGRTGPTDWAHVEKAADYLVANGPRSDQERWENQDGYSPNTIATEIAGLICAAEIARRNDEPEEASQYEQLADTWESSVESWTATTNGPYDPKPYYLRVTKDAMPNVGTTYNLGDNFDHPVDQREIVDNSFLGLVLFGVKPWNDKVVRNSLLVGDSQSAYLLAVNTPSGTVWHRFTFDGYGEQADGGDWDLFDNPARQTRGRLWPLLSGERGEYDLIAGNRARPFLQTIANTAKDGLMLPEQVWDDKPPPGEVSGKGTRSATPLAWTHGQFVRLAWSIEAGKPVERPAIVACRYTHVDC
jgi:glucoamylase